LTVLAQLSLGLGHRHIYEVDVTQLAGDVNRLYCSLPLLLQN